jgi:hypothetical protein
MLVCQMPVGQMSVGQMSVGQMSFAQIPSPLLAPITSIVSNITGSDVFTN